MFGMLLNLLTTHLPKLLTERPDLLFDHALAYAALAKSEIDAMKRELLRRVLAGAIALASTLAFVVLSGVAVMLSVTTQPQTNSMWVLFAVPGVMLVVTLIAATVALSKGRPPVESLGTQLQLDLQTFRAAMEPRT